MGYLPATGRSPAAVPATELLPALARYAADEEVPEYVDISAQQIAPALLDLLRLRAYVPGQAPTLTLPRPDGGGNTLSPRRSGGAIEGPVPPSPQQ